MATLADQEDVLGFLSRRESYGAGDDPVTRIDTHISCVFLVGDRAFKLKRAVDLGYLDFSTPERRRFFCEREVVVNQRTAASLYVRALPITRQADGALSLGGEGEAIDWVVEMRRFPLNATLDRLAARGELDSSLAQRLAEVVARFHQALPPVRDAGGASAMTALCDSVGRALTAAPSSVFEPGAVTGLIARQRAAVVERAALLGERARAGRVRRCHGDLHLRNIVVIGDAIVPFDAIEFDEALATIDVLYDLAFLVMDLLFCGLPNAAGIVLNHYLDVTGDQGGLPVFPLFLSLRAAIRAHVNAATVGARSPAGVTLIEDARRYFRAAQDYLRPGAPRLIAIGGLSGSGKSRLARALAPLVGMPPGARVVRSDVLRKRLAGVDLLAPLDATHYTRERSRTVYAALIREADAAIKAGWAVIADAVFARAEEREDIAAVARANGVPFEGLWLDAPLACLQERVARRQGDASDATADVVRRQAAYDLGAITWRRVDSSASSDDTLNAAARALALKVS